VDGRLAPEGNYSIPYRNDSGNTINVNITLLNGNVTNVEEK